MVTQTGSLYITTKNFQGLVAREHTPSERLACFLIGEYNIHTLCTPYEHPRLSSVSFTIGN